MKNLLLSFGITVLFLTGVSTAPASPVLVDWLLNDNGSVFSTGDALPDHFDTRYFDWGSGLGTISITSNSVGNHVFTSFFDHETEEHTNTYFNEFGTTNGTPNPHQSWEIDEPGWGEHELLGDIYDNALAGELDNTNAITPGLVDDVSMGMGWNFSLRENETAIITLTLSEEVIYGLFNLEHHDPDGSFYFSSSLDIIALASPEPATFLLFGTGLACFARLRRRASSR